jgi:hypothetical protein
MHQTIKKYSNEILELVDNAGDIPRGDIQGIAEAIVINILNHNNQND